MATAYCTEAHERCYHSRTILVENATPVYRREEREAVKKAIEERLYDIFCKYVSSKVLSCRSCALII